MDRSEDAILNQSLKCLEDHLHPDWGDRDSLDVLNRLLAKNARPSGWTKHTHLNIELHQIIRSRAEKWTTDVSANWIEVTHPPGVWTLTVQLSLSSTNQNSDCLTVTTELTAG